MNTSTTSTPAISFTGKPSEMARDRMLSRRGEPLFIAAWRRVLMMHFEVDADSLQRDVPFPLDLRDGRAFVSLVAFAMQGMRPRVGGGMTAWLLRPIASHDFLNVRTYVSRNGEPGIHFLAEWLNRRLAVFLGPATFGLPYRFGHIRYDFNARPDFLRGRVTGTDGAELELQANWDGQSRFQPAVAGSLTEWLMERYTAFNAAGGRHRFFRVWHPPWQQCEARVRLNAIGLPAKYWPWFERARLVGANYSPGFDEVWMGRPHVR